MQPQHSHNPSNLLKILYCRSANAFAFPTPSDNSEWEPIALKKLPSLCKVFDGEWNYLAMKVQSALIHIFLVGAAMHRV
jgi:hypothetical protein